MRITKLLAENVKRLRAVEIEPTGPVVVIGGRNAQGKSSVLDAIEMAIGGKRALPPEPVHRGADKGRVIAETEELVIERRFAANGATSVVVRGKDGATLKSPQALLDSLCSSIAFDPLAFARMPPKEQDRVLRDLLGLDFSDLDAKRTKAYEDRTIENRYVHTLEAQLARAPHHPDAPERMLDSAELGTQLDQAQRVRAENASLRVELESLRADLRAAEDHAAVSRREVSQLERQLADARAKLDGFERTVESIRTSLAEAEVEIQSLVDPDTTAIVEQIRNLEATNRKVLENNARARIIREADEHRKVAQALTREIETVDAEKQARISAARFPVEGLGFGELGPTMHGLPLEQASQAERIKLSVAIGLAMHPELRVLLVRDGSLLDHDSLRALEEMAASADAQIWIEHVQASPEEATVIIEDGEVAHAS